MYVERELKKYINRYNTCNPFELAESLGIYIFYADLGETLGFYSLSRRTKMININNGINEKMTSFVCAHELGHAILHPNANTPFLRINTLLSIDKIEVEANEFATKLLTYNFDVHEGTTKQCILKMCGIPSEMERFL